MYVASYTWYDSDISFEPLKKRVQSNKVTVTGGVAYRNTKLTNRTHGLRCIPEKYYKIYVIYKILIIYSKKLMIGDSQEKVQLRIQ